MRSFIFALLSFLALMANPASAQDFQCRDHAQALERSGLTKCLYPFGILVAADARFPDSYVEASAKIIAQYLDPNQDGQPDHPRIYQSLRSSEAWLPMPWDQDEWYDVEEAINNRVGYGMIAPRWWLDGSVRSSGPTRRQLPLFFEEVTHLYVEFGLAGAFPRQFGMDRYNQSVLSRETKAAWCEYWQHPENNCPGKPAEEPDGDCSDPSCNTNEFVFGVIANLSGNDLGDVYPGLDLTGNDLRRALSSEFLGLIMDPQYGLPTGAFDYNYPLAKAMQ